jgi:hypothetical protein
LEGHFLRKEGRFNDECCKSCESASAELHEIAKKFKTEIARHFDFFFETMPQYLGRIQDYLDSIYAEVQRQTDLAKGSLADYRLYIEVHPSTLEIQSIVTKLLAKTHSNISKTPPGKRSTASEKKEVSRNASSKGDSGGSILKPVGYALFYLKSDETVSISSDYVLKKYGEYCPSGEESAKKIIRHYSAFNSLRATNSKMNKEGISVPHHLGSARCLQRNLHAALAFIPVNTTAREKAEREIKAYDLAMQFKHP